LENNNRQEAIRAKGFDMGTTATTQYGKIKVGVKTLDDAVLDLGSLKSGNKMIADKSVIMRAMAEKNLVKMREISDYFFHTSGIYEKTCKYFATMYRYDWYVVPEIYGENVKEDKVVKDFAKVLNYLDNSYIKKICGEIALKVIKDGAYYAYIADGGEGLTLQELPINYCRSRFNIGNQPAVEFNMQFFDDNFADINYRMRILKMFPAEFTKGYLLYKQGKLQPDFRGEVGSWYLLEPGKTLKFSITSDDSPTLINAIPAIMDLDHAQALDRRKQMQKLLKIIVQKLPLDKNGDLIFDVDEARDIHENAVDMLRNAIGTDVITTFADVESIDLSDTAAASATDDLERVERTVYNAMGVSKNLFNTDGNLSLEKSILNDEGSIRSLLLQFSIFFDKITQSKSTNRKKYNFRLYMLETTQYNYKELSKMYKEHVQLGYSKMLPQIALGHSQSAIINTAYFENEILHLSEIMIPPLMSSTMSSEDILGKKQQSNSGNTQKSVEGTTSGRPEKSDDQKSEKTIQNKESMN
jgi:hypothetical protein